MNKMNIFKKITAFVKSRQFVLATIVAVVSTISVARAEIVSNQKAIVAQPTIAGDVIAEWNQEAVRLTLLPGLTPVHHTRVMAIVQVSVHDAVNGITGEFETYLPRIPAPLGASPEAAAIAASYHSLKTLFPSQSVPLDNLFLASLAMHGLLVNDPGVGYGINAANRILTARANDGAAQASYPYVAPGAGLPGVYVPLAGQSALLPGWGNVTPWVLRSGSQFRPEAPPVLNSEQYARDYNEIKEIGAINSQTRTLEQTHDCNFLARLRSGNLESTSPTD